MSWNDLIGRELGRYVILDELGRGGSSRVYRAHDPVAGRDVAIKVLPNDAEDRVGFVRRFAREVQVVAQLSHPNIVAVYDNDQADDLVYLVMQLVGGGTLRARMGRPLPVPEACAAIVQMARALHHAHVRGIIHRDVKPSNMLIRAEDPRHLLLTDFGIAKIQGQRGLTKSGTTIGTPEYMSPEQAEGKEIDPRADVYSLGCVLYEALAGRPPFIGATPVSVLYQQVHARPSYLRSFNSEVPRELSSIVDKALAKRPEDRFGTALRFAEALAPFAEGAMPPLAYFDEPEPGFVRLTSGPLGRAAPTSGPITTGALKGLGEEGLDALFPDDTAAHLAAARAGAPAPFTPDLASPTPPAGSPSAADLLGASPPPTSPPAATPPPADGATPQPPRVARGKHTIPLNQFRLPPKATRPLDLPLTPAGTLDIEALMARVEQEPSAPEPPSGWTPAGTPQSQLLPSSASPQRRTMGPSGPLPRLPDVAPSTWAQDAPFAQDAPLLDVTPPTDMLPAPPAPPTPLRATRAPQSQPREVWRPAPEDDEPLVLQRSQRRRRSLWANRPMLAGIVAAAVLIISLGVWVGVSASALGLTLGGRPSATTAPTATATATPSPSPTATTPPPTATATATADPQKALDKQAAASFRAITLGTFVDGSCSAGNARTSFSPGQTIYVNLCTSGTAANAPTAVYVRQNGKVLYVLDGGDYIGPNQHYYVFRYGIPAGSYDCWVTQRINGTVATAADIPFTVG